MRAAALAALLVALLAAPAAADRLVTRDGSIVETLGPWEARGGLVVFRDVAGRLASLRLSEVDLEASAELAADPAARAIGDFLRGLGIEIADDATLRWTVAALTRRDGRRLAPMPAVEPVLVLTDADVGHVEPQPPPPAEGGAGPGSAGPGTAAAAAAETGLEIAAWDRGVDAAEGGLRISGRVRNSGDEPVAAAAVTVLLYGASGGLVGTGKSAPRGEVLRPGAEAPFEIVLPGITEFETARFHVHGTVLHLTGAAAAIVD